ncbi:hypothetical protein E2C01_067626 [Portunus trituberculatus]|uniref:Uncharacterized protein n=1 Tax=Portunus trituberculatus TaxID=210409 RepID=A0A5B7HPU4_PORTR|nr:hypothetical protein [Portunus trituberculatus]
MQIVVQDYCCTGMCLVVVLTEGSGAYHGRGITEITDMLVPPGHNSLRAAAGPGVHMIPRRADPAALGSCPLNR